MGPSINKFKGWESMDWSSIRKSRDMKLGMGLAPWLVVWVWGSWWVGSGGVRGDPLHEVPRLKPPKGALRGESKLNLKRKYITHVIIKTNPFLFL